MLLVDHAPEAGRKILISGGGRANFTNLNAQPEHFLSQNPHFAKSALARYMPQQFVALVERYGIGYHAKAPGQLFCDGSARQLVELLLAEAAGAELRLNTEIVAVAREKNGFALRLRGSAGGSDSAGGSNQEETVRSRAVVVATGGLSIPKLGATGFGYELAQQFGLSLVPTRAALVPLTFNAADAARFEGLSGVATEAEITLSADRGSKRGTPPRFRDKLLITHRGLSGPAVLQISSYWRPGDALSLDMAPDRQASAPLLQARRDEAALTAAWSAAMPRRLAERLLALAPPQGWSNDALLAAEQRLHRWTLTPGGTEGYAKAEVTAGGVATDDLQAQTMEARQVAGLYFIGEVVDVTGHLGGYNFQWAWASAAAAAQGIMGS